MCWSGLEESDHSEDRATDGRMASEWKLGSLAGGVEWIQLTHDRDQWWDLVKEAMNLWVLATELIHSFYFK
jgi:hypothetical protein